MKASAPLLSALFCCLAWAPPAPAPICRGVRDGVCLEGKKSSSAANWRTRSNVACRSIRISSLCWSSAARCSRATQIFFMVCPTATAPSSGSAAALLFDQDLDKFLDKLRTQALWAAQEFCGRLKKQRMLSYRLGGFQRWKKVRSSLQV